MNITITIPDAISTRVVNGLCDINGYDTDSGLTKAQFAKQAIISHIKKQVITAETNAAKDDTLVKAAESKAISEIVNIS